ncbi:MAG: flap endonuclease-1 [Candidatus Micrarchaeota archaeon]
MGVQLGDLASKEAISLDVLNGKTIAVDAFNTLYQFLSIIRQADGMPLVDMRGRITSHLSGLFYRSAKLLEVGIKPVYVFDGKPFHLKTETIEKRVEIRAEAERKWKDALARGEAGEARTYAQGSSRLTSGMIAESKQLLTLMGIPYIEAPSEGEAEASHLAQIKSVYACASQDYDALLFGAPLLLRNLTISGKRKLPGRDIYIDVSPELINLENTLEQLKISREQLVWLAILTGTDFNQGIKGIGPKKALKIVSKVSSLEDAFKEAAFPTSQMDELHEIENFFLHPPVSEAQFAFREPEKAELVKFLCGEHGFSEARVEKIADTLKGAFEQKGSQSKLNSWFG